jgi:hypothetical protein
MKGIFGFFLVVVASHSATALAQPWERFELKDEMRGTVTHSASIKSTAAGDENVTLVMQVVDKGRNEQGIVFQLSGGAIACDEHICNVSVKFGDGEVTEESMAVDGKRTAILPTMASAFSGAVGLSKEVFVEIPLTSGPVAQFKFVIDEPAFPRVQSPNFKFAGVSLGDGPESLRSEFSHVQSSSSIDCREAKALQNEIPGITVASARMCFYKDKLYMAFINTAGKKDYEAVAKYMTSKFGKKDSESYFETWPAGTGKVLDMRVARATFWPKGKTKGVGQFLVIDESISLTVPK